MQDKHTDPHIDISLVIPVYNEEESLPELEEAISNALSDLYTYEIIFVDDGSSDNSWSVIKELSASRAFIHGISFHHNYGKSVALQAGFEKAQGDYVVTLDSDLQDDPNEIPEMIQMLEDGYDLVSGWKRNVMTRYQRPYLQNSLTM